MKCFSFSNSIKKRLFFALKMAENGFPNPIFNGKLNSINFTVELVSLKPANQKWRKALVVKR